MADESGPADGGQQLDLDDDLFVDNPANAKAVIRVPVPHTPNLRNKDVKVREAEEIALFEGDIALYRVSKGKPDTVDRGIIIANKERRWPDGVLPYVADPEVAPLVEAATRHWEERSNARFVGRTNENDYVHFKRLNGSWSFVGRQGGMQEASLGANATIGTAIHEIGHALGLWHEQSRSDRDEHVIIHLDRVPERNRHNFDKQIDSIDIGTYDTNSIMHYSASAFSGDGRDTIVTRNGVPIGQRNGVSAGDISAVNRMYPRK